MRVRSAGCTHAYWKAGYDADVLAFGIAPHIIQGCTKCLAICTRDTLVRRCRCCCVAVAAVSRRPSLIPTCSSPVTGRARTPLSRQMRQMRPLNNAKQLWKVSLKNSLHCRCLCLLRHEPLRRPKVGSFVSKRRHNLQPLGVDRPHVSFEPGRTRILFFPLGEISIYPTTSPFSLAISISNRPVEVAFNHSRKNHLHEQMDQRKSPSRYQFRVSQFLF